MLDTFTTPLQAAGTAAPGRRPVPATRLGCELFAHVLDEVDYGLLLVDAQCRVLHANHVARHELATRAVLALDDTRLVTSIERPSDALAQALARACQGHRFMLDIGQGSRRLCLAFVPLAHPLEDGLGLVLLICGKREVCQAMTLRSFARCHGLTPAEEQVLREVCTGAKAGDIARKLGVGVSTVRSQLGSIRTKTRTASLRQLVKQVALLPPLVSALRLGEPTGSTERAAASL